jgi:hypothetical protein
MERLDRGRELVVVVSEGGAGDGQPGQGEHGEGDIAVPGFVKPDLRTAAIDA